LEQALLEENQRRFNQAAGSPFMKPPLSLVVGKYAETMPAISILQAGSEDQPNGRDRYTNLLLDSMRRPPDWQPLQVEDSKEAFVQGWCKSREHTAAGPSGLHFGHFIAACKHPELQTIEWQMATYPLRSGYSPQRWQQGVEVMLLKQQNNFNIQKLRAILLFEADFNFNNKRIGRSLMWRAEDARWLAPEQYGSRKAYSAIDHCLNKQLSYDILRQYRQAGAICINDMKGCYDRIVHSVASICMQRWGMPMEPIRMMFYTLQHLKHFVRTAFGLSKSFFQANDVNQLAIQGIGQGNGAGPQVWAAISSVLLDILRKQNLGAEFTSPISKETIELVGYAYTDDTDIIATIKEGQNSDDLRENMQQCFTTWEGCIAASGGQLEASKTYWYLIDFKWANGKWRYTTSDDNPASVLMRNSSQDLIPIERLEVTDARRTLGVRLAPDGNNEAEYIHLKQECDTWAARIRTGMVPKQYAWQAFSSTIWAKIAYALPATTLSQSACDSIMKQMVSATLSKAGINQHLPRDLVFGDISRQGLGIPDLPYNT
jgi:hypothetical protein